LASVETQRTTTRVKPEPCDPRSLERGVRQLLADKVSGNLVGLWLLVPEHLRLGTWDLLRGWAQAPTEQVEPRLALQLVHEAALCLTGIRHQRALSQPGFELMNGLPFLASDPTIHQRQMLVLADAEHFTAQLLDDIHEQTCFDLLVPMPHQPSLEQQRRAIPPEQFTRRWAGYATAKWPYQLKRGRHGPSFQFVQRLGERPEEWTFKASLATADREEVTALTKDFPQRWHAEEFFNAHQALGWDRAGTQNLNIRYGHMTLALLAQAVISQLRHRLGEPAAHWDASHLAQALFQGIEGDLRVRGETILVTCYNAPQADRLRDLYEDLPAKLEDEHLDPRIPWLYNFKLDFRFR
jgi:hypothetical protein